MLGPNVAFYAVMDFAEATRLRMREDENRRLKKLVADQALDIDTLEVVNAENGEPRVAQILKWNRCATSLSRRAWSGFRMGCGGSRCPRRCSQSLQRKRIAQRHALG